MRKKLFQVRKEFIDILLGKLLHNALEMVYIAGWPVRQLNRKIKRHLMIRYIDDTTELVCTGKVSLPRR